MITVKEQKSTSPPLIPSNSIHHNTIKNIWSNILLIVNRSKYYFCKFIYAFMINWETCRLTNIALQLLGRDQIRLAHLWQIFWEREPNSLIEVIKLKAKLCLNLFSSLQAAKLSGETLQSRVSSLFPRSITLGLYRPISRLIH